MADAFTVVTESLDEVTELTGVPYPNPPPIPDCSGVVVAWNEEQRIEALLLRLREWFPSLVIGVQASSDRTLDIARSIADRPTDQILEEPHLGFGDASMHRIIAAATTKWVFDVACDEWPDDELLESLGSAIAWAERSRMDGVWVPFRSWVEGIEYEEQHGHLRLFHQGLGWPKTLHARPAPKQAMWWPHGHINHTRSLDEMMQDYLRYYAIGKGNPGWEAHNLLMMHDACAGVAQRYGWDQVTAYVWWPQVASLAFSQQELYELQGGD